MKIRILVLSPFRYIYGSKEFYITTGESIYLDTNIPEELEELRFLLSPFCEYAGFLYIEESPVVASLLLQVKDVGQPEAVQTVLPVKEAQSAPTQQLEDPAVDVDAEMFTAELQVDTSNLAAPFIDSISKEEKAEIVEEAESKQEAELTILPVEEAIEARLIELQSLGWRKVKKIAQDLSITYTNEEETISKIIEAEFNDG